MPDPAESSTSANAKRKLWIACNACRFRKVKCDREPRLEQGFSSCTNCEAASVECILTVNPPKKRIGKRMKMLQEQSEASAVTPRGAPSDSLPTSSSTSAYTPANGAGILSSSTMAYDQSLGMSPGLSSLLEAVSQEEAAISSRSASLSGAHPQTSSSLPSHTNGAYDAIADKPAQIIQNGMFAAFSSGASNFLQTDSSPPTLEPRRVSSENIGATSHPTKSSSPANGVTPRSASGPSEQSSPDVITSHAAFSSTPATDAANKRVKRRNPFDRSSADSGPAGQVGFVGGLLGITSLDKQMLDVCTKAYFDSLGQCIGFIRPEWYWPRYHAFFSRYAGMSYEITVALGEPPLAPLSELLLIAVACRGASASQLANRFELQTDLFEHYCRLIKDRERLVRDGFDALESTILMVEHVDSTPRPLPDPISVTGVYDVDVLTHEGMIRLMKKLELHLDKPFGVRLEGRDMIRQQILFWVIYVYDAIRSEAGRTLPLIQEDEFSLDRSLPLLVGEYARILFRDYFLDLAAICRKVAYRIQSPRVQGQGIDPRDVIQVLDDLKAWHDLLVPPFSWDWNDMLHITGPTGIEPQARRTFLITLFLAQWMIIEYAVEEIGISSACDPVIKGEMLQRLRAEVDIALDRHVLICDHGTLFGIIRLHPDMMQSWTIAWATWCLEKMQKIIAEEGNGRLASAKADQAFHRYQSAVLCFINATASCDSAPHTPTAVQDMMNGLKKVIDARKVSRLTFDRV